MKQKTLIIASVALFSIFLAQKAYSEKWDTYAEKHREIVLRSIGHRLMLHANDSTHRVLPVNKIRENLYQIEFESQIAFVTDTLISLVDKQLATAAISNEYIVSVLNCKKLDMVFGYEVSKKNGNVLPCSGRTQPKGCYVIQIEFLQKPSPNNYSYFLFLIPIAFISYFLKQKYFPLKKSTEFELVDSRSFINIGSSVLYPESQIIKHEKNSIELTEKETKLLKLLVETPNQTVEREVLMNELWEADGITVIGRSLDVLVSKLRKKLETDPQIKILNVHGKGYKLVMS